jgi:hypothetical protein
MSRSRTVVEAVAGKTSMPRNTSGVLKGERAICGSWCSGGLASGRTGLATIDITSIPSPNWCFGRSGVGYQTLTLGQECQVRSARPA